MPSAKRFAFLRETVRNHPVIVADDRGDRRRPAGRVRRGSTARDADKPQRRTAHAAAKPRRRQAVETKPAPKPVAETTGSAPAGESVLRPIASSRPGPIFRATAWRSIGTRIAARGWSRPTSSTSRPSPRSRRRRLPTTAAPRRQPRGLAVRACCRCRRPLRPAASRPRLSTRRQRLPAPAATGAAARCASATAVPPRLRQPWPRRPSRRSRLLAPSPPDRQGRRSKAKRRKSGRSRRPSGNRKPNPKRRRSRTWMTTATRSPAPIPTIALRRSRSSRGDRRVAPDRRALDRARLRRPGFQR